MQELFLRFAKNASRTPLAQVSEDLAGRAAALVLRDKLSRQGRGEGIASEAAGADPRLCGSGGDLHVPSDISALVRGGAHDAESGAAASVDVGDLRALVSELGGGGSEVLGGGCGKHKKSMLEALATHKPYFHKSYRPIAAPG